MNSRKLLVSINRLSLRAIVGILVIAGLGACDVSEPAPPIVVGAYGYDGYEPLYWAETLELYPEGSVHLVETPFDIGLLQAFRGAAVDAQTLTLSRIHDWQVQGVDAAIVLPIVESSGIDRIIAQPGVTSLSDLKGKRVGLERKTVNEYVLRRALETVGLTLDDLVLVEGENDLLFEELMAGNLDAISAYGDETTDPGPDYPVLFSSTELPGEILDILAVRRDFLVEHPDRVIDLVYGILKASEYFHQLPDDALLPQGSVYNRTKADIRGVTLLTADQVSGLFADNAAVLRELLTARATAEETQIGNTITIDTEPFVEALKRLKAEQK